MNEVSDYFSRLSHAFGTGWNRFWFSPSDPLPACVLRVLTGLAAWYYVFSHSFDLLRWFGDHGLLTLEMVQRFNVDAAGRHAVRFSPFYLWESPVALWIIHGLALLIVTVFTVGLASRVASVFALVAVLGYVHRGPLLSGQFETVLTMVLAYLCLAPTGACLSVDRWLNRRQAPATPAASVWANVSIRLIQVHLAGLCLMTGLTMLAAEPWWNGLAMWWLIARPESRLVDLTFLHAYPVAINLWTHGVVTFQLVFGVLIWNRLARPLLLGVAIVMWVPLALLTGHVAYFTMLLIASLAFVSADGMRTWLGMAGRTG